MRPRIFAQLEAAGVEYVVAMGTNPVLDRYAEPFLAPLRAVVASTHDTATTYGEAAYQTRSWPAPRRTIIKAEVVWHHGREPRDNPRFVITNLRQTPEWIYTHVYCARGIARSLKELKRALAFGRTSCTRFWANRAHTLRRRRRLVSRAHSVSTYRAPLAQSRTPAGPYYHRVQSFGPPPNRLHFPRSLPDADIWTRPLRPRAVLA